jgi:hypothetical protein
LPLIATAPSAPQDAILQAGLTSNAYELVSVEPALPFDDPGFGRDEEVGEPRFFGADSDARATREPAERHRYVIAHGGFDRRGLIKTA